MDELPLDVICYIAKHNYTAWIRLMLINARFREFAWANPKQIIDVFKTISVEDNSTCTRIFDKLHSFDDLPAVIWTSGSQAWYANDKRHRDNDLPAYICATGKQVWYVNSKRHRDNDLPATIYANGMQEWWVNGKCHRDNDLPAIIYADGSQEWWVNGKRIR